MSNIFFQGSKHFSGAFRRPCATLNYRLAVASKANMGKLGLSTSFLLQRPFLFLHHLTCC